MRLVLSLALIVGLSACAKQPAVSAAAARPVQVQLNTDQLARTTQVRQLGYQIFFNDTLAWRATDLVMATLETQSLPRPFGWTVDNAGDHPIVHFYTPDSVGAPKALMDIHFEDLEHPTAKVNLERELSAAERSEHTAILTAIDAATNSCSATFNFVVLPGENGQYEVYVLASTTVHDRVVIGGHSQVTVSADGLTVLATTPFSKSCLALDIDRSTGEPMVMVTHIVSDIPAPTHVFLSLQHQIPVVVQTDLGVWYVNGDQPMALLTVDPTGSTTP